MVEKKSQEFYVIDRDPSRGGQVFVAASDGITPAIKAEIKDRYSELITKNIKGTCLGICPLRDGRYAVTMAYKVGASKNEYRYHEIVRGLIMEKDELEEFSQHYLAANQYEKLFFPTDPDPDSPADWILPDWSSSEQVQCSGRECDILPDYLNHMAYDEILGLSNALKEVERSDIKIQLLVPEGMRPLTMAVLNCIAIQNKVRLFMLIDGECTLEAPDILIVDSLDYLDARKYQRMTLKGLINWGNSLGKGIKKREREHAKEKKQQALLDLCRAYVLDTEVSTYELQHRICQFRNLYGGGAYEEFLRKLRSLLYEFDTADMCQESFMELFYLCFYMGEAAEKMKKPGLEPVEIYDYPSMIRFIEKKTDRKRDRRRITTAMLRLQFRQSMSGLDEKSVQRELKKMLKK